jgi:drug/metabolite transporter (DMT)-like permease
LVLTVFIVARRRPLNFQRAAVLAVFISSIFFALDLWFWHRSILYVGPGLSTLLANFQVFIMAAVGIVVLHQRPSRLQLFAIPLAIIGLTMIIGVDWGALTPDYRLGVIFGLLTAVSYAGYLLAMRQARSYSDRQLPINEVALMSLLVAALLGVAALAEGQSLVISSVSDGAWLVCYGVIANAIGMMAIASSLSKVTTTEVGLALLLQPALSFVWDILFFARQTTMLEAVGAVIALSAIFLGSRAPLKKF